jgi:hypothetical protein
MSASCEKKGDRIPHSVSFNIYHRNNIQINNILQAFPTYGSTSSFKPSANMNAAKRELHSQKSLAAPIISRHSSSSISTMVSNPSPAHKAEGISPPKFSESELHFFEGSQTNQVEERQFLADDSYVTELIGYLLILLSGSIVVTLLFWGILSKFLPPNQSALMNFMQNDSFYCLYVILAFPFTYFVIYGNWVFLKYFRHS